MKNLADHLNAPKYRQYRMLLQRSEQTQKSVSQVRFVSQRSVSAEVRTFCRYEIWCQALEGIKCR